MDKIRLLLALTIACSFAALSCSPAGGGGGGGNGGSGVDAGGGGPGGGGEGGRGGMSAGGAGGGATGTGGTGTGGVGTGGGPGTGGTGSGGVGSGGTGTGGAGTGGASTGGAGGMGTGAGGTGGGGAGGSAGPPSGEDDGADCTIATLPDTGALTTIARLPDPFKKLDGTAMTTKAEWRCRREEIKRLAEKFVYGAKPAKPQVTGTVSRTSISVTATANGKSATFTATVRVPSGGAAPYPAIILYASPGFGAPLDDAVVQSEGVAMITYNPYSVGQEGTGRASKQGAFYTLYGANSTTGLLTAWGWGVSRLIDVIAQSDGTILEAGAVAVTGCSRFGKGAFVAGVLDQRVALTMPIESGTAGVPILRGVPGEGAQSLTSAYGEQPWFGDAFTSFTGAPTRLPIDTHEMVAMIAPRGLFIMDNPHIPNLGPRSGHVAALAGAEVYKALGAGANITYHSDVQNGMHCDLRPEWSDPLRRNLRKFLNKTASDAGVIKAAAKATGNLADWRDWVTPALN